jgi:biopolymer transport protein TolR
MIEMSRRIKNRKLLTEINVIPYVDISLVLLVIFMVATPFMIQGIDLDLPKAESQALNKSKEENLTISVSKEGFYSLDLGEKDKVFKSFNKFSEQFLKVINNNPEIEIFIRADKETIYENVIKIMSLVKNYKTDSINLITEPPVNE